MVELHCFFIGSNCTIKLFKHAVGITEVILSFTLWRKLLNLTQLNRSQIVFDGFLSFSQKEVSITQIIVHIRLLFRNLEGLSVIVDRFRRLFKIVKCVCNTNYSV